MERYLGLKPGSVSPFGLINDEQNHVHLFLDANLRNYPSLSFHPNDNTATVMLNADDLITIIKEHGNEINVVKFC